MTDSDDRWYFTKERLNDTPSRKHGYDADKELSCRQQAANFIQDMGQKLQVSQLCINTAIVYMHRFYVFHSLSLFHRNAIATAALFLAAKVEEQPRKVEHVLKVAHLCLHRETPSSLDTKSELYQEQSNDLVVNESILLQTLGFDVAIDHPHTHVVRCCQLVKASKDLAQTSYFMASNSLHLTTMCLQYKPTVVACFCIHLACKWSNWEIPRSSEGKDWFWYVNQSVTLDLLEQLTSEFLLIFDKCPTKLKRKMMSMNQNNPPVNFGHATGGPQESYHFDEPRKLIGAEANRPPEGFLQMQMKKVEKNSSTSNANNGNGNANANVPITGQPNAHTRHIDYKEYKEKKERERIEQVAHRRDAVPGALQPIYTTQDMTKQLNKMKQQQQQLSQRPPSSAAPHKAHPQQQRQHSTNPPSAPPLSQRPPVKESGKRKFDEIDGSSQSTEQFLQDPNQAKNYARHKHPAQFPQNNSHTGQTTESHPPNKDVHIIRDIITQSLGTKDKSHRTTAEVQCQNYPYQRSGTDKYASGSRPQQSSVIIKPQRDDVKNPEEIKVDEGNADWLAKQGSVAGSRPHEFPRAQTIPHQKTRDPKHKNSSHHHLPQKDVQKHFINLIPTGMSHSQATKKPTEKPIDKRKYHEHQSVIVERGLPSSMESLLSPEEKQKTRVSDHKKGHHGHEVIKKEKATDSSKYPSKVKVKSTPGPTTTPTPPSAPSMINPFKQELQQQAMPGGFDIELTQFTDAIERPSKIPRIDDRKKAYDSEQHKSVIGRSVEPASKPAKTFSIFSPDSNVSPKNAISSLEKDIKKCDVHFSPVKKPHGSLFSPPSVSSLPNLMGARPVSTLNERDIVMSVKTERESLPSLDGDWSRDHKSLKEKPYKPYGTNSHLSSHSSSVLATFPAATVLTPHTASLQMTVNTASLTTSVPTKPVAPSRHSHGSEARAVIFPPSDKVKMNQGFQMNAISLSNPVPEPKMSVSPVSTVNLLGMEKMVDTSISPSKAAVLKPIAPVRLDPSPMKIPVPLDHEKKQEEKPKTPGVHEAEIHKKMEKKKKDKDKDKDGHRHKEKKKSDGKKEKKKHKDKDKERKKDSHRDKEKYRDECKGYEAGGESHLKITIPKEKLSLSSTEGQGLKIKIAKDRLKQEDLEGQKPEGGLKIKIKKEAFTHYKEEPKTPLKKREGSHHNSHHKSSKPPKTEEATLYRSSKKSSENSNRASSNRPGQE